MPTSIANGLPLDHETRPPIINSGHLVLVIKVTDDCPLRCVYCSIAGPLSRRRKAQRRRMRWETAEKIVTEAMGQDFAGQITFEWHGGEPLLAGIPFYEKVLGLQRSLAREGLEIENVVQTNGILIDAAWVEFLLKNDFAVGVSWDGPTHDLNRRGETGEATSAMVLSAIRSLAQQGHRCGVLTVVTKRTLAIPPDEFLDFYINAGIEVFDLLSQEPQFVDDNTGQVTGIGANLFAYAATDAWLAAVFEAWLGSEKYRTIRIRTFENIMRLFVGLPSRVCSIGKGVCPGNLLGFLPDGSVFHCDKFFHDERYRLGNINRESFASLLRNENLVAIEAMNRDDIQHLDCRWKVVCRGGCPFVRYALQHTCEGANSHCCGHRVLFDHIFAAMMHWCPDKVTAAPEQTRPCQRTTRPCAESISDCRAVGDSASIQ